MDFSISGIFGQLCGVNQTRYLKTVFCHNKVFPVKIRHLKFSFLAFPKFAIFAKFSKNHVLSFLSRTQNDPDLRLKKMFKYVVSARFLVSFKILWSSKRCLDDK